MKRMKRTISRELLSIDIKFDQRIQCASTTGGNSYGGCLLIDAAFDDFRVRVAFSIAQRLRMFDAFHNIRRRLIRNDIEVLQSTTKCINIVIYCWIEGFKFESLTSGNAKSSVRCTNGMPIFDLDVPSITCVSNMPHVLMCSMVSADNPFNAHTRPMTAKRRIAEELIVFVNENKTKFVNWRFGKKHETIRDVNQTIDH